MGLVGLVVLLLVVGIVLHFFPMDGTIKGIILCLILIAVVLTIAHWFGWTSGWHFRG